jgi:phosphoenolpyruvate synthase/pyruvate phosphate dikinase
VILKETTKLDDRDRAVLAEFSRNQTREGEGSLGGGDKKLHIDKERIDLDRKLSLDLAEMRRNDSGIRGGPKAAYLGELKFLFPDMVARGLVVPFGAYYEHYRRAQITLPRELAKAGIAKAGTPLHAFVEKTYAKFFGELIPAGTAENELRAWIEPRLTVIRTSIEAAPISKKLEDSIRNRLAKQGLLRADDPTRTTGVFIRSDTNVEDLDEFNGAGLNLTLFDRHALDDVFSGLKQVWASPFTYRSFSWRQALIDDPLWVLPSVVILESISTEKSGVLVTIDVDRGDTDSMLIATSEGVGGAVDGSPAETLIVSPKGMELVTMFKSPWRRMLQPEGGSAIVPSTRSEYVLSDSEIASLTSTAREITAKISPAMDDLGRPRPWDIEFGFADGRLWLFQVRPFLGSESMQNLPSLAAYDPEAPSANRTLSLAAPIE